jgi:hypothetical protein
MRILKTDVDVSRRTVAGFVVVDMSEDGTPLKLAEQSSDYGDGLKLWFISERPDGETDDTLHYLALVMTGQEFVPVEWNYLSSFEVDGGIIVHAFYVPSDKITQEDKEMPVDEGEELTDGEINESEVPED